MDGLANMEAVPGTPLWHFRILSSQVLGIKVRVLDCKSIFTSNCPWLCRDGSLTVSTYVTARDAIARQFRIWPASGQ